MHVRDIAELENCISNNSKILTWKQAKADKANGLMDFTDETVVELEYADGSKFEQRDTTLCLVAGGGAPDNLEFQGEVEEPGNPVVEIEKNDWGTIIKIKEKDK